MFSKSTVEEERQDCDLARQICLVESLRKHENTETCILCTDTVFMSVYCVQTLCKDTVFMSVSRYCVQCTQYTEMNTVSVHSVCTQYTDMNTVSVHSPRIRRPLAANEHTTPLH